MLEYAYKLEIDFPKGLNECKSLEEFYERLAHVLARCILDRGRKGFYRAYVPRKAELVYIRGRLDVQQAIQKPWDVKLRCHYEEHTADIEENQILAWSLFIIARSGLCTERVLPAVRQAYRALQGLVTLQPSRSEDCVGRRYNRLNKDYRPLHALCRFFLENSGPTHRRGDRSMLPFVTYSRRHCKQTARATPENSLFQGSLPFERFIVTKTPTATPVKRVHKPVFIPLYPTSFLCLG